MGRCLEGDSESERILVCKGWDRGALRSVAVQVARPCISTVGLRIMGRSAPGAQALEVCYGRHSPRFSYNLRYIDSGSDYTFNRLRRT